MYCSSCGANIAEGARFCPKCGAAVVLSDAEIAAHTLIEDVSTTNIGLIPDPAETFAEQNDAISPDIEQQTAVQSPPQMPAPGAENWDSAEAPRKRRGPLVAVVVALIVAALGVGGYFFAQEYFKEKPTRTIPITLEAEGLDGESSPIPIRVKAVGSTSSEQSGLYPLAADSPSLELSAGTYTVAVGGSPVTSAGILFTVPEITYEIEVPETEDESVAIHDAAGNAYETVSFIFDAIAPQDVSESDIDAIRAWMEEAHLANPDTYIERVVAARSEAVSRIEAEEQAAAEAKAAEEERKREEAKAAEEARRAEEEAEAAERDRAKQEAIAANSSDITLTAENIDTEELVFTGTLKKLDAPDIGFSHDNRGQPHYYLELDRSAKVTLSDPRAGSITSTSNEIGVGIGYNEQMEAHLGETVTVTGTYAYSELQIYTFEINIDGTITHVF